MAKSERWKQRPENSTWGDYGPDDQLGRMNELNAERTKQAVAEVKAGRSFCLSMPLDLPGGNVLNPRRHPPLLRPTVRSDRPNWLYRTEYDQAGLTDVINDDMVLLHLQYSSQWDTLAHVGSLFDADGDGVAEPVFYNGFRGDTDMFGPTDPKEAGSIPGTFVEAKATSAAKKLGVENLAEKCLQGRGVMIDLQAHFGRRKHAVTYDDLMRVMAADGIKVEPGDFVCLRTGFDEVIFEQKGKPTHEAMHNTCTGLDGSDTKLHQWITESKLVALISDNYAVEVHNAPLKPGQCAALPLHQHCLFKTGVNLGEIWRLSELADWLRANNRSRFLMTAPPLNLPGAVGSPANAIATV
ncbi:MAG: cyclase family protein [Hyphomicrobium sp.]|uniref:cyclase family protein n=1 Tax=Hyphomicrobium sp. CS1BSMeth3 TaxID=1892844 RepID=UPI0009313717|nr:cyclase family protein [Hyphomicrobium sp. CS1BSMeth3]MBN9262672.1 cyclase family protein [Hyphomicrobium sp.]